MLQHFYGYNLNPPGQMISSNLISFGQQYYTPLDSLPSLISMDSVGYVYVPTACQTGKFMCRLLVAFHGCLQGYSYVGFEFINNNGLNQMAETNNVIVLYPQVIPTDVINPDGCWDWWGYTGPEYATKLAPQISTVRSMMNALMG
jgi:poly(3-hydroxybutyrate) depolymerase